MPDPPSTGASASAAATEKETKPEPAKAESVTPNVTPPDGKVELDEKSGLAARHAAYRLLGEAASRIAKAVTLGTGDGYRLLLVEDRALVVSDWHYRSIAGELEAQTRGLQTAQQLLAEPLPPPETEAPGEVAPEPEPELAETFAVGAVAAGAAALIQGAQSAVAGVAGIAQLFQTDYSVASAAELRIEATPLVSAVAEELRKDGVAVVVDGFHLAGGGLVDTFFKMRAERDELAAAYLGFEGSATAPRAARVAELRAEVDATLAALNSALTYKPENAPGVATNLQEIRKRLASAERDHGPAAARSAVARATVERFDTFAKAITTVSAGEALAPLAVAATRQWLHDEHGDRDLLFVQMQSSSGETITHRSTWHSSKKVLVMGGVVASWMLLDPRLGITKRAGTVSIVGSSSFDLSTGAIEQFTVDPPAA